MNPRSHAESAHLRQVLIFYDEPQLILLQSDRNKLMLAVAVYRDDMENPFFGCELQPQIIMKYFQGHGTLRYAFENAYRGLYYFFDFLPSEDQEYSLKLATKEESEDENFWPMAGTFARSHTEPYEQFERGKSDKRRFFIDGTWESRDFSRFHGKMSDVYAFYDILNRIQKNDKEAAYIKKSIQDRFWQGGGSYGGFYGDLKQHVRPRSPLGIAELRYSSPGHITFRGDGALIDSIDESVDAFLNTYESLVERYKALRSILSGAKLLRAGPNARFPSKRLSDEAYTNAVALGREMGVPKVDQIFEACDANILVFSKVILSIFRRLQELYMFHAEGRVTHSEVVAD
jgi:hypothetical protein